MRRIKLLDAHCASPCSLIGILAVRRPRLFAFALKIKSPSLIVLKFGSLVLGARADPAGPASPPHLSLWRPAGDNGLRSRSACDGRRRKDREVGVAASKSIEADLAIADGGELTAQETWRGAVL